MNGSRKRQLVLSSHRGRWRNRIGGEPADAEFSRVKPQALAKDAHSCVYCGLRMEGKGAAGTAAMEVHHFNGDHENNGMQNLGTTDYFCHACNHIGFLGKNAVLGFLPELSLIDTNHLFRTMAVAIASGDEEMKQAALEIEEALRPASDVFAQVWGTKNPTDIGNAMLAMPKEAYDSRDVVMSGVRVLFNLSRPYIRQVGETVLAKAHTALKPDVWPEIANQYLVENLAEWESLSQGELSKQDGGVVNA